MLLCGFYQNYKKLNESNVLAAPNCAMKHFRVF